MKTAVVTYATDVNHPGLVRRAKSLAAWGWPVLDSYILTGAWRGWCGRLKYYLEHADALAKQGYTHMVATDAYDIVCTGPPEDLEPALAESLNPAMLMATEAGCWPDGDRAAHFEPRRLPWWYPHSQFCLDLTQPRPVGLGDAPDGEDDQRHFTDLVLAKTAGIKLDTQCRVVQSCAHSAPNENFFAFEGDRLVNRLTGSKPLFLHSNGKTDTSWFEPHFRG